MKTELQIIGLGYIGLPTAVITSSEGIITKGVEIDESYLKKIKAGLYNFNERELNEKLKLVLSNKYVKLNLEILNKLVNLIS